MVRLIFIKPTSGQVIQTHLLYILVLMAASSVCVFMTVAEGKRMADGQTDSK